LRAAARALQRAELRWAGFEAIEQQAGRGDLVYFDPPYVPVSKTSNFTNYTHRPFRVSDHVNLQELALRLKRRGVYVILSHSSAVLVRELYSRRHWRIREIAARRRINSRPDLRGPITELLIY